MAFKTVASCCSRIPLFEWRRGHSTLALPKRNSLHTVRIDHLAYGGDPVAVLPSGALVELPKGISSPGDTVEIQIKRKSRKSPHTVTARAMETIEFSRDRIEPPCKHFGLCGGCRHQQMSYEDQIYAKTRQLREIFQQAGLLDGRIDIGAMIGCKNLYRYRNKMEFSYSNSEFFTEKELIGSDSPSGAGVLGMHPLGVWKKVVKIGDCLLTSKGASSILNACKTTLEDNCVPGFDSKNGKGFLQGIAVREGSAGGILLNFLTNSACTAPLQNVYDSLMERSTKDLSNLTGIVQTNASTSESITIMGPGFENITVLGVDFEVSANSFFQVNTEQTQVLYQCVLDALDASASDILYDMFCGTGSIGLCVARKVKAVRGFEINESAVTDAKRNAAKNGIQNATFHLLNLAKKKQSLTVSVEQALREESSLCANGGESAETRDESPSLVVLDPPRAGLHPSVIDYLRDIHPRRLVYVSCNPVTQAADIAKLLDTTAKGRSYHLASLQPVDMFPHTPHIETVALLLPK